MKIFLTLLSLLMGVSLPLHADEHFKKIVEPILIQYCYDCHGDGSREGDYRMDDYKDFEAHLNDRKQWMPVWKNLRSQIMPPSDEAQPSFKEKRIVMEWIEKQVFKLDPLNPDPGRITIRRMNREEYKNSIMDLLAVDYDTRESFPPDDSGYGFDNNSDVLSMSPLLMEKYLAAAEEIMEKALPTDPRSLAPRQEFLPNHFQNSTVPATWIPFTQEAEFSLKFSIPTNGVYSFNLEYSIQGALEATTAKAFLEINLDGKKYIDNALGWNQGQHIEILFEPYQEAGEKTVFFKLKPGSTPPPEEEKLYLCIEKFRIVGPLENFTPVVPKSYEMIFGTQQIPQEAEAQLVFAREILRKFTTRAFRGSVPESDVERLLKIVKETQTEPGKNFQDGIKRALTACLASPRFLFRAEIPKVEKSPSRAVAIDEYALASRLSFFLWSSIPDHELLDLASKNSLRTHLRSQVDRMLADPKAQRLTENFVGQWLLARDVATIQLSPQSILGTPSKQEASQIFDPRLRDDMQTETYEFFNHILHQQRPAVELIAANYSFLNQRLAHFYGIQGVEGEEFRRVDLSGHPERGGLLTQGSFLIVSSNPTRTSPVKRGIFVLENLLGTPPPPAPPNIPELETATKEGTAKPSMREMMEIHRKNPDCRGCHARMDPIGLGLENYDALGRYRKTEGGKLIDTAGQLVTGETFSDVAALKSILSAQRKMDFYRTLSEKLLTFSLGRGIEYFDTTVVEQLSSHLEKSQGSIKELIHAITASSPFQMSRGNGN